jgi:hypothetical protein
MGPVATNGAVTPGVKLNGVVAADEEFGDEMQWNGHPNTDRDLEKDF